MQFRFDEEPLVGHKQSQYHCICSSVRTQFQCNVLFNPRYSQSRKCKQLLEIRTHMRYTHACTHTGQKSHPVMLQSELLLQRRSGPSTSCQSDKKACVSIVAVFLMSWRQCQASTARYWVHKMMGAQNDRTWGVVTVATRQAGPCSRRLQPSTSACTLCETGRAAWAEVEFVSSGAYLINPLRPQKHLGLALHDLFIGVWTYSYDNQNTAIQR